MYITPADEQERFQVQKLAQQVQQATGKTIKLAFVDRGYTGNDAAVASAEGIELKVVKLSESKKGFVLFAATLDGRTQRRLAQSF